MNPFDLLPRTDAADLPGLVAEGLPDRHATRVITASEAPVCLAVSASIARLAAHAHPAPLLPLYLTAGAAAEYADDLLFTVRRVGRLVYVTDAPGGGEPVVLVPIEWARDLYPAPRATDSP
jgi:hypothetical protein